MTGTFKIVKTTPFSDQRPGTSGLRKKVSVFQQPHYTETFIQSCFNAIPQEDLKNGIIVVGGDGRYFSEEAFRIILSIGATTGISKFITGINGILSTPAASYIIRSSNAIGGFILTASHNPGGPTNDFGIKYNCKNGGPAPEAFTERIYKISTQLTEYKMITFPDNIPFHSTGQYRLSNNCSLDIINGVDCYTELMKSLFDFNSVALLAKRQNFKIKIDCMSGVTGPFAKRIFIDELGFSEDSVINSIPTSDFSGHHPDPNLTYATELVGLMSSGQYDFGSAFDGDGDRNMILGKNIFVNPSDSVAIIAANYLSIPYFRSGLKGLARSMPTSGALDRVAKHLKVPLYETPTGWKYFGNLMDANKLSLCGEESFGQGSDCIREKDGIWAALAWLSILSKKNMNMKEIVENHWIVFGRNVYTRYDYEDVSSSSANNLMNHLQHLSDSKTLEGTSFGFYTILLIDNFEYIDPIDNSKSEKQGIRILLTDSSRIIFRLSGTGSSGATVRMYIEKYESNPSKYNQSPQESLKELIEMALNISHLKEHLQRTEPTVIT